MKAFTAALESMGKKPFSIGEIPPTTGLVDEYFNDSTGEGDEGETDAKGPWNQGGSWKIVDPPELERGVNSDANGRAAGRQKTPSAKDSTRARLRKSA